MGDRDKQLIRDAVEESIEEVEASSPADPVIQPDVVVEMATARFNQKCEDLGYEPDFEAGSDTLEVKAEVEVERQLGILDAA